MEGHWGARIQTKLRSEVNLPKLPHLQDPEASLLSNILGSC